MTAFERRTAAESRYAALTFRRLAVAAVLLALLIAAAMQPYFKGGPDQNENIPILIDHSASMAAVSGDHSAGLWITVLPAARAGASFHVESMKGAFHGVMTMAGPAGIRTTRLSMSLAGQCRSSWAAIRSA